MRDNEFEPFQDEETEYINQNTSQKKGASTNTKPKKDTKTKGDKKDSKINTQRIVTSFGAILSLLSIFLFFACISYFLTWKADQDSVIGLGFTEYIFNNQVPAPDNWLGKLGAWFSHMLIFNGFGIPSIGFSFLGFLFGVRLLFKTSLLPLLQSTVITLSFILWGSLFLGFFNNYVNFAGGTFGYFINEWLILSIGSIPTFLFHLLLLYIKIILKIFQFQRSKRL